MSRISRTELQLARGRIMPLFLRYAMPGVLAWVFLALQTIADGFIVGRLIGADALASVNIAAPVYSIVTAIAVIIGVGTQAQVGISLGASRPSDAKTAFISGLAGLAFFSLCGTLLVNLNASGLSIMLGADDVLKEDTVRYIYGVMPFLPGIAAHIFFDNMLKAIGHPRYAMVVTVSTIVMNVVLSLIFVTIFDMGTFGAGLGTGLSFTCGGLASALLFLKKYSFSSMAPASGHFSFRSLGHIFYNGSSEGLSEFAYAVTTFLFNITLMRYVGKEGVAAFTLVSYLTYLGISISLGISNGVIPIVSYNYGAERYARVRSIVGLSAKTNTVCGIMFLSVLYLFSPQICSVFIDPSETAVMEYAILGARMCSFAFLFNGFNILASSYFTAIDKAGYSLLISSLRGLVLLSACIIILPEFLGFTGIVLAMPIAEAITFVTASLLLKRYLYRQSSI